MAKVISYILFFFPTIQLKTREGLGLHEDYNITSSPPLQACSLGMLCQVFEPMTSQILNRRSTDCTTGVGKSCLSLVSLLWENYACILISVEKPIKSENTKE